MSTGHTKRCMNSVSNRMSFLLMFGLFDRHNVQCAMSYALYEHSRTKIATCKTNFSSRLHWWLNSENAQNNFKWSKQRRTHSETERETERAKENEKKKANEHIWKFFELSHHQDQFRWYSCLKCYWKRCGNGWMDGCTNLNHFSVTRHLMAFDLMQWSSFHLSNKLLCRL